MNTILKKITLAGFGLIFCFGCESKLPTRERPEAFCLNEKFKERLEFSTAKLEPVTEGIHLTGNVESHPDNVVNFVSLVGGIVSKTYFSLGDEVKEGQVLAELKSTDLSSMQTESSNLKSQIEVAENNLNSVKLMYEDEIASEKDLLEARTELNILKSESSKIDNQLNFYSASSERGVFLIKAPKTGIITSKTIATGSQVSAEGDPLFTISDLSDVWVMVNIYATNIQHVKKGMSVNIETMAYPDTVFKGTIASVSAVLDSNAKVLKARIELENKDLKLKPGMLVDVIALKEEGSEAIAIPTQALVFDNNANFVVIYENDCDLRVEPVEILSTNNGNTYVKSGVKEHDQVISKNQLLVFEQLNY